MTRLASATLLTALLLVGLAACGGDDDDDGGTPTPGSTATPGASPTTGVPFDFSRATTTSSGLAFIDLVVGSGERPRIDQLVAVHYTLVLASNGQVVESTAGGEPASIILTQAVRGLAEGLLSMREGGRRLLYLPASLAYGDKPPAGSGIPVGADLVYEVELIAVK